MGEVHDHAQLLHALDHLPAQRGEATLLEAVGRSGHRVVEKMRGPHHAKPRLEKTIAQRRTVDPSQSYVASLHAKGLPQIARKLGEEGVEAAIATLSGDDGELVGEAADILFHLLVALDARDIEFADVLAELDRREGVSGIEEKASRSA